MDNIEDRLKELKTENFIWIIYLFIILLSYYSNYLEKQYFLYSDLESKEEYRKILIIIFSILVVVYLYFLKNSIDDLRKINIYESSEKKELFILSFIASLLIAISGFIFLYIAYKDQNIDIELAFN